MTRLRVVHVVLNLDDGGLQRLVVDLARKCDREQFEPHVLVLNQPGRQAADLAGVAEVHQAGPAPAWALLHPRVLAAQLRRIAPDIVHTHSGVWYKASLAARMAGVSRLLHTDHGRRWPDPWIDHLLDFGASRRTDVVIAVSTPLARFLRRRVHVRRDKIRVIRNGVDTDRFRPASDHGPLRASLGLGPDVPILGSIGRLDHIKGYDLMLDAFARLRQSPPPGPLPMLVIAGEGPEREALQARVGRLRLEESVRFLKWRKDVETLHAGFTLFTLASRSEGTSLGLLEALSAGLCPVVTNVGGNGDVLGASLRHRLVAPENPDALADGWRRALADPGRRAADARAARARVLQEFSLSGMVAQYAALYTGGDAGEIPVFDAPEPSGPARRREDGDGVTPVSGIQVIGERQ